MPILDHYEVEQNGSTVVVLLTEKDAAKLNARRVEPNDIDGKMRTPANKMRTVHP